MGWVWVENGGEIEGHEEVVKKNGREGWLGEKNECGSVSLEDVVKDEEEWHDKNGGRCIE